MTITAADVVGQLMRTGRIDINKASYHINSLYELSELAKPAIIPIHSPNEALDMVNQFSLNPYSSALDVLRVGLRNQVKDTLKAYQDTHNERLTRIESMEVTGLQNITRRVLGYAWDSEANKGNINPWLMAGDLIWLDGAYRSHAEHWGAPKKLLNTITHMIGALMNTHVLYLSDQIVLIMHRPEVVKLDQDGAMHCENDCAWRYSDGNGYAYWHGTEIPVKWVQGYLPHPAEALQINNVEQRRCACEMIGWDAILRQLDATVINTNPNPEIGTLVEVMLPNMASGWSASWAEPAVARFLRVRCGTGRDFALPVPPEINTALEANAWTYGISPSEYNPKIRT